MSHEVTNDFLQRQLRVDHSSAQLIDLALQVDLNSLLALRFKVEELKDLARALITEIESLRPEPVAPLHGGISMNDEVRRFEVKLIRGALLLTRGHQVRASRLLGLKATTLNAKIKRYEIRV